MPVKPLERHSRNIPSLILQIFSDFALKTSLPLGRSSGSGNFFQDAPYGKLCRDGPRFHGASPNLPSSGQFRSRAFAYLPALGQPNCPLVLRAWLEQLFEIVPPQANSKKSFPILGYPKTKRIQNPMPDHVPLLLDFLEQLVENCPRFIVTDQARHIFQDKERRLDCQQRFT